ncbi:hypothetical protein DFA_01779 [Cavenderia fasciculata]|uniref:Uncharacterized protein n=1 Tax=Cavenderia fasciculata TaxID=261658 RepID=F4PUM9_CACFS|nr:uncharacterized protein DFA_01779 [Cavenderia fasciculata]EGG21893.1 hypothetical protein DFA_01779 [Cavenderia fasciculata]|eukprot:XP_004359744.1 hypothetical protein DFA_01779 [Cavenderia fasciculata]
MTSHYQARKEGDLTYTYAPNSPNVTTYVTGTQVATEHNVINSTGTGTVLGAPIMKEKFFAGQKDAAGIPIPPPIPPTTKAPISTGGNLNNLISSQAGNLKSTNTPILSSAKPLNGGTTTHDNGFGSNKSLNNNNNKPLNGDSTRGTTGTTHTANDPYYNANNGHNLAEPHKPSTIMKVKGVVKEKFGHITKNQRLEEEGKQLEAQFAKDKLDYQHFQDTHPVAHK